MNRKTALHREGGRACIAMGVFWVTTLINGIMTFLGEVLGVAYQ